MNCSSHQVIMLESLPSSIKPISWHFFFLLLFFLSLASFWHFFLWWWWFGRHPLLLLVVSLSVFMQPYWTKLSQWDTQINAWTRKRTVKKALPLLTRIFLVATFIEDSIRGILQRKLQVSRRAFLFSTVTWNTHIFRFSFSNTSTMYRFF